jgi:ATP-dependent Clp protease protease subunit
MQQLPQPKERIIFLDDQVNQKTMNKISKEILDINDSDKELKKLYKIQGLKYKPKPIKIYIDSYGGLVYQCFGLVAIMNKSKVPIWTYVTGAAMSCGFIILIHGHKRFAYEHSTPLYHQVSSGVWGTVKDMEEKVVESKRLLSKIEEMTLSRTNITKKKLKEIYEKKLDWFMTAEEAKKLNVVDEVI